MINFDILMNSINVSDNKSSFNKSDVEMKSINFEDVIKKQEDCKSANIDKKSNKNGNFSLNDDSKEETLGQLIDSFIKNNDKFIEEISSIIEEDLSEENAFNIINIFLTLHTIEQTIKNNNSISFENIEFVDINSFSEKYLSLDNTFDNSETINFNFLGKFMLEENTIKIPIYTEKDEFKVLNITNDKESINNKESINIEDIFEKVVEEYFELELNNKNEKINQNKSLLINNENNILDKLTNDYFNKDKKDIYNKLSDELLNKLPNKLLDELSDIEDFKSVDYKDLSSLQSGNNANYYNSSFNDFLINQRLVDVKFNKNTDNELELLLKIQNSNSEVTNNISPYSYGLIDSVNGKINENIQPQTIRYSHFESDLANTISHMKNSNLEELTIKVKPKELGEITINLIKKDGLSEVVIFIEKEELFDSLKRDISRIEAEIKKTGLTIDNISIEVKKQEGSSFDLNNNSGARFENSDDYNKKSKRESKDSNKKDKTIDKDDVVYNVDNKSNDLSEISILA